MEKGVKLILFIFVLFLSVQFVSAEHQVSPATISSEINSLYNYTITIINTDIEDAGVPATNSNITKVDITLPSGLIFITGTEGTGGPDSAAIFSSTSNVLTWTNTQWLISSSDGTSNNTRLFWFRANATTLGTFSIKVNTTNTTGTFEKTISLTTSDSSAPTVTLISPDNNADDTDGVLVFKCNATDNIAISSIKLSITSNGSEIFSNIANFSAASAQRQAEWDYTFSNAGTYKWNCFANDTLNNLVWGTNRTLTISAIAAACSPNWDCDESDWSSCLADTQTRICNDLNSCGNNATKPDESQVCALSSCTTADWSCTGWTPTECPQNGTQIRTCTKDNSCSGETGKPSSLSRTCEPKGGNAWIFITIILVLVLGGGAAAAMFYFKNRNPAESASQDNSGNQQQPQNYGYSYQ